MLRKLFGISKCIVAGHTETHTYNGCQGDTMDVAHWPSVARCRQYTRITLVCVVVYWAYILTI